MTAATMLQVKEFFGMPTREFSTAWKALTDQDKEQLKAGIGNGSLTY